MKIAYFDCFSGISGDMVLGGLLDLGVPKDYLVGELKKLPLEGYSIDVSREMRGAVSAMRVRIDAGHQPSRTYRDIRKLIEASSLDTSVRDRSLAIFDRIAQAESQVHQVPVSEVHFHEVGAVDSILDVVGAAIGLDRLGIDKVYASRIPLGRGFVRTHHGILPVPAPATVLLLSGVPVYDNGIERELVTPTGAAIVTTIADAYGSVPEMTLRSVGYGAGSHPASDPPNVLRVMIGDSAGALLQRELLMIETNIDDMNPEFYSYVMERLFSVGALDVSLSHVQMKKNRPAVLLRVLVEPALQPGILDVLFKETTTLGVRVQDVRRIELQREVRSIETPYGRCLVKRVSTPDGDERMAPEYEECRRIAEEHRLPLRKIYEEISWLANRVGPMP